MSKRRAAARRRKTSARHKTKSASVFAGILAAGIIFYFGGAVGSGSWFVSDWGKKAVTAPSTDTEEPGAGDNTDTEEPGAGDNTDTEEPGAGDNTDTEEPGAGDNTDTEEPGAGDNTDTDNLGGCQSSWDIELEWDYFNEYNDDTGWSEIY